MISPMLERFFRLEVGSYWLLLPGHATVSAAVTPPAPAAYQLALTPVDDNFRFKKGDVMICLLGAGGVERRAC
jgi:hypothetical protein